MNATIHKRGLREPVNQVERLAGFSAAFSNHLAGSGWANGSLTARSLKTFQVNVGKKCNQACKHCHVDASPARTEMMSLETMNQCLDIIRAVDTIETIDITGGAPEMNQHFRYLVQECKNAGKHVIDRCNLTILEEPGFEYLYEFLSQNEVEIVASLPHFSERRTDKQRGTGVFDRSITALQKLNQLGYGDTLPLNLVYNPVGLFLSGDQAQLEREFKEQLGAKFGIQFNNLYCINNMPVSRFLEALVRSEKFEDYMTTLVTAFNPSTVEGLMCRDQISVSYDGKIYDCDFNQMLEIEVESEAHVADFNLENFLGRNIKVANHCYGCTAGAGSSCGGEIA